MECTQTTWPSTGEYLRQFNEKAEKLRIPLSGSLELTHRCNLRCVHCFLRNVSPTGETTLKEMHLDKIVSVINEITEAGCLDLLITGGEPFLREDFPDIYRHAKLSGMLVSIFTNATLLTDRILGLFQELPPRMVEISVYGATADTYEKITGVNGSFHRCMLSIERLLDHGVTVKLKTILMTLNQHEFSALETMANNFGVPFRFDADIFPRFNGDKTPVELRVSPEESVEKEFSDDARGSEWLEFHERFKMPSVLDSLYHCGAGVTSFHINPYGALQPCLMTTWFSCSLYDGSFLNGWQTTIPRILERKPRIDFPCKDCRIRMFCAYCPAFFGLENGEENLISPHICATSHYRFNKIKSLLERSAR